MFTFFKAIAKYIFVLGSSFILTLSGHSAHSVASKSQSIPKANVNVSISPTPTPTKVVNNTKPVIYQNYGWYTHNGQNMQYVNGQWYSQPQQNNTSPTSANTNANQDQTNQAPVNSDYATVVRLYDSKGNEQDLSEYNGRPNTWSNNYPVLKAGDTVTITVDVNNTVANPVQYEFVGTGFPNNWQTSNSVTVNINPAVFNEQTEHLRVFVKNSDNKYRAPDYDDMVQVFYIIQ